MSEQKNRRIKIRKEDPVAEQLASPTYRQQVKPSKKRYRRAEQKRQARGMVKEWKDPMNASPAAVR